MRIKYLDYGDWIFSGEPRDIYWHCTMCNDLLEFPGWSTFEFDGPNLFQMLYKHYVTEHPEIVVLVSMTSDEPEYADR